MTSRLTNNSIEYDFTVRYSIKNLGRLYDMSMVTVVSFIEFHGFCFQFHRAAFGQHMIWRGILHKSGS